jgi:peptidoglycan/LPS O-acetylase OafA/YrhL
MIEDKGLQGMRGIASLQVLFFHIVVSMPFLIPLPFLYTGDSGVELFFVISAYILTKKYLAHDYDYHAKFNYIKYYLRRIFRIWPLYVVGLFLLAFVQNRPLVWEDFLFLQNYFWQTFTENPIWTLTIEEVFYVLLPVWVFLFTKNLKLTFISLSVMSIMYGLFISVVGSPAACTQDHWHIGAMGVLCANYLYSQFPLFAICYVLGTVAAMGKQFKLNWVLTLLVWFLALIVLQGSVDFLIVTFGFAFVSYLVLCNLKDHWLFTNKVVSWLGSLTYPIYLLGVPMLWVGMTFFNANLMWIPVDIFGTIGLSYVVHRFFEKPLIGLGRSIESRLLPNDVKS